MSKLLNESKNSQRVLFASIGLLAAACSLPSCTTAQPPVEKAEKAKETQALSEDLRTYRAGLQELADRIKAEHPRPFRFISEDEFDRLVAERVEDMTAGATYRDFMWALSEVLSSIKCGHSSLLFFNQENALINVSERFPVDVRFVNDRLYVLDPLKNSDRLTKGDEIVAINGQTVSDLRETIFKHIRHEGVSESYRNHAANYYATSYITYALNFPARYEVELRGENRAVNLSPLDSFEFKKPIHPKAPCQEELCYRVEEEANAGIMTIRSFAYYGERGQVFSDFVDEALNDVVTNDRAALIIDVRGNGGGSGYAGSYILRRLAETPFAYWSDETDTRGPEGLFDIQRPKDVGVDVPVYLLVDGNTTSATPHFAALFKEHHMGIIVGEPMGGNKSTNDGAITFSSSVHGIEYRIARMRFDVKADSQPIDEAVQPDIRLYYTVEDILDGEDSMLEHVLMMISDKKG